MTVKRGPYKIVRGPNEHSTVVNFLREVADEVQDDPDVRGVVVVIDRDAKPTLRYKAGGRLKRLTEKMAVALYRIAHLAAHKHED